MKTENKLEKQSPKREKASNQGSWSDGEHRIINELYKHEHCIRFFLITSEQILFRFNMPIPRIGDIFNIKLEEDNEELRVVTKLFKRKIEITHGFSQEFRFMVKSVECTVSDCEDLPPDYTVIIEPLIKKHKEVKIIHL